MWIDEIYVVLFLYRVEILDLYVRTLSDITKYLLIYINLCFIYTLIFIRFFIHCYVKY